MFEKDQTLCPSGPAEWKEGHVFGVVGGTADRPEVAYLDEPVPVDDALLALSGPVPADEVFRIAVPCAGSACAHFSKGESRCRLAGKIVRLAEPVVDKLPACTIRANCRWWKQEGPAACARCPQVVTVRHRASEAIRVAADPSNE